jgi:hypothetical protein
MTPDWTDPTTGATRSVGPLSYLYVTKSSRTFTHTIGAQSLTPAWGRRYRLDWGGGGTEGGSR